MNRAVFSPDGSLVATVGDDKTARIWNARTGVLLHVLRGHTDKVDTVGFSADSKRLVTAGDDHRAMVWNVSSGRRTALLRGHDDAVVSARFSSDGALVVTSGGHTARLWDARSGNLVATLRGHTDDVHSAQFTADGRRLMTYSDDGTARIWHVPPRPAPISRHHSPLSGAALSRDESRVLTWSKALDARLIDTRTARLVRRFGPPALQVANGVFLGLLSGWW